MGPPNEVRPRRRKTASPCGQAPFGTFSTALPSPAVVMLVAPCLSIGTEATGRRLVRQRAARIRPKARNGPTEQEIVMASAAAERDPRHHTQKMQNRLQEIRDHLREDIKKVDEPQLKAMFETSAEVLGGLIKAFRDYEQKNESA